MDICLHRFCEWVEGFLPYRDIKLLYYLFYLPYVLVFSLSNFRPNLDDGNELEKVSLQCSDQQQDGKAEAGNM